MSKLSDFTILAPEGTEGPKATRAPLEDTVRSAMKRVMELRDAKNPRLRSRGQKIVRAMARSRTEAKATRASRKAASK